MEGKANWPQRTQRRNQIINSQYLWSGLSWTESIINLHFPPFLLARQGDGIYNWTYQSGNSYNCNAGVSSGAASTDLTGRIWQIWSGNVVVCAFLICDERLGMLYWHSKRFGVLYGNHIYEVGSPGNMTKDGKKQKNNPGRVKFYVDEDVDMTLVDYLRDRKN